MTHLADAEEQACAGDGGHADEAGLEDLLSRDAAQRGSGSEEQRRRP